MSAPQAYSDLIYIGQITKPHGLKGEVSALLLTDNHAIFNQLDTVFLIKNDEKKITNLQYYFLHKNGIVIKLDCFESKDEINGWVGSYIAIPPYDSLVENGSYHIYQIYSLRVIDESGESRGAIEKILDNNGNWILVIATEQKKIYVPFAEHFCRINREQGTLLIPDDLWKQLYEL
jgi:16S rRNA processing protein RimM